MDSKTREAILTLLDSDEPVALGSAIAALEAEFIAPPGVQTEEAVFRAKVAAIVVVAAAGRLAIMTGMSPDLVINTIGRCEREGLGSVLATLREGLETMADDPTLTSPGDGSVN